MSRSSPGVRRFVSVLNFFADHPGQAFTLTDLVRALKLSRATCHGLLTGLVEAGYLYRTSDKSYLLGPALVAIGEVAAAHFSPLQAAQPEMRALADAYDATCSATFREHGDLVLRERATSASQVGNYLARGARIPLLPQFASLYFMWSSQAEIDAWLDELDTPVSALHREAIASGIAFLREHGFMFSVRNPERNLEGSLRDWLLEPDYRNAPLVPAFDLAAEGRYNLGFVQAPVLDAQRRVAFVMGLQLFQGDRSGVEVAAIGHRVRDAAIRVSSFLSRGPRD